MARIIALGVAFVLSLAAFSMVVYSRPHVETFGQDSYLVMSNYPVVSQCDGQTVIMSAC